MKIKISKTLLFFLHFSIVPIAAKERWKEDIDQIFLNGNWREENHYNQEKQIELEKKFNDLKILPTIRPNNSFSLHSLSFDYSNQKALGIRIDSQLNNTKILFIRGQKKQWEVGMNLWQYSQKGIQPFIDLSLGSTTTREMSWFIRSALGVEIPFSIMAADFALNGSLNYQKYQKNGNKNKKELLLGLRIFF